MSSLCKAQAFIEVSCLWDADLPDAVFCFPPARVCCSSYPVQSQTQLLFLPQLPQADSPLYLSEAHNDIRLLVPVKKRVAVTTYPSRLEKYISSQFQLAKNTTKVTLAKYLLFLSITPWEYRKKIIKMLTTDRGIYIQLIGNI